MEQASPLPGSEIEKENAPSLSFFRPWSVVSNDLKAVDGGHVKQGTEHPLSGSSARTVSKS